MNDNSSAKIKTVREKKLKLTWEPKLTQFKTRKTSAREHCCSSSLHQFVNKFCSHLWYGQRELVHVQSIARLLVLHIQQLILMISLLAGGGR